MTAIVTIDHPAYFDRLAEVEAAHWWSWGMWRIAAHFLNISVSDRRGLRALDIGCGTGLTAVRLARRPEIDFVIGLDASPAALDHARRRHDLPLVLGSALDLPFEDCSFDLVTCFDVLQHLPAGGDLRAASELHRVLRPSGVALIRSNAVGWDSRRPAGAVCYRLNELLQVLWSGGFRIRRATHANCLPALAQELRGVFIQWLGARRDGVRGHPAGGGLRFRTRSAPVNWLMKRIVSIEAAVAGRLGLPFGHTTIVLASRLPDEIHKRMR